ncbi:hypothetical protein BsWGS_20638 [Bradybaena similaris]
MPIDARGSGDASIHSHSGDCNTELSGKYAEYIEENREALVAKCERVNNCIEGLLKDENVLLVLKGDNLSLNKTCSLIYENSNDTNVHSWQCTAEDREDIREDLDQHLALQLDNAKAPAWKNVNKCLKEKYGSKERSTYVNDICGLAFKTPQICDSRNVHRNVTTFFNNQIQHLQCTCRSLENRTPPEKRSILPAFLGGLAGGLLLLLIIGVIGWLVYRRRKARKSKNSKYLPAPTADYPVYQDIYDDKGFNAYGTYPAGQPPGLPQRFARSPTGEEDESAYLEPVEAGLRFRPKLPVPGRENPSYGAPPEYSERAPNVPLSKTDAESGYFQPLPHPPEDSGLHRNLAKPENGYETVEEVLNSPARNTPNPEDVRLIPTPVKRTQSNRQADPGYVTLEPDGSKKAVDTTV